MCQCVSCGYPNNIVQIVKAQELNNIDGERLHKERIQVEEALKLSNQLKEVAEKSSWEAEMALSEQLSELEANVRAYARRFQSVCVTVCSFMCVSCYRLCVCVCVCAFAHPRL